MSRFNLTREFYIPTGATKVSCKGGDAVAYLYSTTKGEPCAVFFSGKRAKPDARYRYRNAAEREASVGRHFAAARTIAGRKADQAAQRRETLAKPHGIEVGHIFSASWGYDQTNVNWYEVTAVVGRRMVEVREIAGSAVVTGMDTGTTLPLAGQFIGRPLRRMVGTHSGLRIDDVRYASLWNGCPERFSTYA